MKNRTKKILLTFDYELFLGKRSGSIQDCLILPTKKILSILKKNNCTAIFFIDATYIFKLEQLIVKYPKANNDYLLIKEQINSIVELGHDVFLHLHTHWIDAIYIPEENQWDLSKLNNFQFSKLTSTERVDIFNQSLKSLQNLIKEKHPNYKIEGFRAGGLCIQPFSYFKNFFKMNNIKYEFSVAKNLFLNTKFYGFNFENAPSADYYNFENDVLQKDVTGGFNEYTISIINGNIIDKLANSIWYRLYAKPIRVVKNKKTGLGTSPKIKSVNQSKFKLIETASIENLNEIKIYLYLRSIRNRNYFHFISHPKLCKDISLSLFNTILKTSRRKFELDFNFRKWL